MFDMFINGKFEAHFNFDDVTVKDVFDNVAEAYKAFPQRRDGEKFIEVKVSDEYTVLYKAA